MFTHPLIRASIAAALATGVPAAPAAAAQLSFGVQAMTFESDGALALPMVGWGFDTCPERGVGFDFDIRSCLYVTTADLALTYPVMLGNARITPRFGPSWFGVAAAESAAGLAGGVELGAGPRGSRGLTLDVSTAYYPDIEEMATRVGVSYQWGAPGR